MADQDFFLSPDDSMTMGDIDFMRTSKRTRRTFPKTLKNKDGFAIENEVSSMEDRSNLYKDDNSNGNNTAVTTPAPTFQSQPAPAQQSAAPSRKADTSMDMFRNMAKKIRR